MSKNDSETIDTKAIERQQEAELAKKYPGLMKKGPKGNPLLQKKLLTKQKYFDSGDYNVAKSKPNLSPTEKTMLTEATGNAIPTPEEVHKQVPLRASSLIADESIAPHHIE